MAESFLKWLSVFQGEMNQMMRFHFIAIVQPWELELRNISNHKKKIRYKKERNEWMKQNVPVLRQRIEASANERPRWVTKWTRR